MMEWTYALVGAAAGAAQAGSIARSASGRSHALAGIARWALVGAVLFLAVRAGHAIAGTSGWASGFVLAGAVLWRRMR